MKERNKMKDFDYDVREKKRIAAGARHRKQGSKSRRCVLPHEYLTPAQLQRRNGQVRTFHMNRPMDAGQWTAMPEDLQRQYIRQLRLRYNVGTARVAAMLGMSSGELRCRLEELGLWDGKRRRMRAEQAQAWERWLKSKEKEEEIR